MPGPWGRLLSIVVVGLAMAGVSGCGGLGGTTGSHGVLKVVAGENFWGSIAGQIGGVHVRVTSIFTDPNADPHLYESSAANAVAVAKASLIIRNGAGYDDWLSQLLGATRHSGRIVITVQQVLGMTGSDMNPHFWYDIPQIPNVAAAIEAGLVKLEPQYTATFAANLAAFDRSLDPLDTIISHIRQDYRGAPVAYTERVPGYLLQAAGLRVETPVGFAAAIENGNDPSPADTLRMDQLMTGHEVKVLLYNAQTVSAATQHVESLARSSGIPVVAVTETMPGSYPTYQAWQLAQAEALLQALGGSRS